MTSSAPQWNYLRPDGVGRLRIAPRPLGNTIEAVRVLLGCHRTLRIECSLAAAQPQQLRKMPRSAKALFLIALFAGCAVSFFVAAPTGSSQLVSVAALLLLLSALPVALFYAWRHRARGSLRAAAPLLACLVAAPIGLSIGGVYRDLDFRYRRLPAYEQIVRKIELGELPGEAVKEMPTEMEGLAYGIHVHEDAPGGLMVVFFWGGGFPVKHSVYIYRASGLPPPTSAKWEMEPYYHWPQARRLNANWFAASD